MSNHLLDLKNKKGTDWRPTSGSEDIKKTLTPPRPLSFSGLVSVHMQKTDRRWLTALVVLFGALALFYGLAARQFITAFFFGLLVAVLLILALKEKREVGWELTRQGLKWGNFFYSFSDLHSFWIRYEPGLKELSFRGKKWYHPYIKIPLSADDPLPMREWLLTYLPEERHEDTLVEILSRRLGF